MSDSQTHSEEHHEGHAHASDKFYYMIAIVLAIITLVEVLYPEATKNIEFLHPYYMPLLGIMSLLKFYLVVAFFMHLKFDPVILTRVLVFSMVVATVMIVALILLLLVGQTLLL